MISQVLRVLCATTSCMIWTNLRSFSELRGSITVASSLGQSIKRKKSITPRGFSDTAQKTIPCIPLAHGTSVYVLRIPNILTTSEMEVEYYETRK